MKKVQNTEKPIDVYEEYTRYCRNEFEDDVPSDAFYYAGVEEAEKGNLTDAIPLFEEALARGDINAADAILATYKDILDICACEEDEANYYEYKLILAQKMQEYGKIIELEIKRRF